MASIDQRSSLSSQASSPDSTRPILKHLSIQRFRGLHDFSWTPGPRLNLLLGGGDAGKTTILEAIALLLSPSNSVQVSEADYWKCDVESGFVIEGAFSIPPQSDALEDLRKTAWPWRWNGKNPIIPDLAGEESPGDPVVLLRVAGSDDFEVAHGIHQPSGEVDYLPVGVRRRIGLVWLRGDDRNDKDLRLVYGSALDRLLGADRSMKARLAQGLATQDIRTFLTSDARDALAGLDSQFRQKALPNQLDVGIAGSPRLSLTALIGLTAQEDGESLPLTSWGAGTRRLAALEVAAANQKGAVVVVDELERGLEPHRQRLLMKAMAQSGAQGFVTSHSPVVVSSARAASVWHLGRTASIGLLSDTAIRHAEEDPEAFLSPLPVVVEGKTEVGFLRHLLDRALDGLTLEYGVWITNGRGNDQCLGLLEDLSAAGIRVAGFVDNEGRRPTKWANLQIRMGDFLFQWTSGCLEENVLAAVPDSLLEEFVVDPAGDLTGERLRTLQVRTGADEKDWRTLTSQTDDIRSHLREAALGIVPEWVDEGRERAFKSHSRCWFKSEAGGLELGRKCTRLNLWPELEGRLLPFLNRLRIAVADLPSIDRIGPPGPPESQIPLTLV